MACSLATSISHGQLDSRMTRVSEHAQNATWLFYLVLQAEDSYCFNNVLNFSFPARYILLNIAHDKLNTRRKF